MPLIFLNRVALGKLRLRKRNAGAEIPCICVVSIFEKFLVVIIACGDSLHRA
jgi:hypothetical protein